MTEELKEKGTFEPLTPAKSVPARPGTETNYNANRAHQETVEVEVPFVKGRQPLDSTKASNAPKNKKSKKRSNNGVDLNDKPKKRPRMKKHRPKIFDSSKPRKIPKPKAVNPSTPKSRTPARPIQRTSPLEKRKYVRKSNLESTVDLSNDDDREANGKGLGNTKRSCKKSLDFNLKNHVINQSDKVDIEVIRVSNHDQMENNFEVPKSSLVVHRQSVDPNSDHVIETSLNSLNDISEGQSRGNSCIGIRQIVLKYQRRKKSLKHHIHNKELDANLETQNCKFGRVYRRTFRLNECLKNSRKVGPNFPKMFKKLRLKRKRATVFKKFGIVTKTKECSKKSNLSNPRILVRMILPTQKQRRAAISDPVSFNCVLNLCPLARDRKKRSPILRRRRKLLFSHAYFGKHTTKECALNLTSMGNFKRKRSNASTKRKDLSVLVNFHSKSQVARTSIPKVSSIKTQESEDNKAAACVEVQGNTGIPYTAGLHLEQNNTFSNREFDETFIESLIEMEVQDELGIPNSVVLHVEQNNTLSNRDGDKAFLESLIEDNKSAARVEVQDNVGVPYSAGLHPEQNNTSSNRDEAYIKSLIEFAIQKLECLRIDDECKQLVVRHQKANGALVPSKRKFDPSKKRKPLPKVHLDEETVRAWNLLMESNGSEDTEELDDDKKKYWEEQKETLSRRIISFIALMHLIQGDRRFSKWNGSVVDSVIGVFLTQNVSDNLSSSTFMSLAARFPVPPSSEHGGCDGNTVGSQESNNQEEQQLYDGNTVGCQESNNQEEQQLSDETRDYLNIKDIHTMKDALSPEKTFDLEGLNHVNDTPNIEELKIDDPSFSFKTQAGVEPNNGDNNTSSQSQSPVGKKKRKVKVKVKEEIKVDWDELRKKYSKSRNKTSHTADSVDWEAVRQATVEELAKVIKGRGMNNILAGRIKDFLDRMVKDHGSIDLEWLRDVPPDKAKDYLLSIPGLGLKSVECLRLLTLHHHAFPVDTNIGRILVRLGWVPLQPLPEDVQIHLLNHYPLVDTIQKYIWPRLSHHDQLTLYELHYQLITMGKVFCTKRLPNCNACPMRGDCRHFASAFASSRLRIQGPQGKNMKMETLVAPGQEPQIQRSPQLLSNDGFSETMYKSNNNCEPIVEMPASPEPPSVEVLERDIEDFGYESEDEIPTIRLNSEEFTENVLNFIGESEMSKALVTLSPQVASIPMPKLKYVSGLRTVHQVYELPDSHPLLNGFEKREADDPCPYLLAIWAADENTNCSQQVSTSCQDDQTVRGTILIPCRTANRGSFPLNGTYFQVNEVFADHESSRRPIAVSRESIWNLRRRSLYCGTSVTSIFRGLTLEETQYCFWKGFICVRGVNRVSRQARPLAKRFHFCKTRLDDDE
ncbi:hypothetical protein ACJIZ3_017341 [Penstemon smallii]|uniref:HhH-GPD domain-containing protein n=1 Tax=Penstemon smallii TaxID=265156 RepID=A0ABD3SVA3_9LAMI